MTLPRPVPGLEPGTGPLVDRFGRVHTYLRVSVTDRCNLACTYCVPDGSWRPRAELLTFDEIVRLVTVTVRLGVRRVRLTGGEPLARRGVVDLVARLATLGLDDLAMTTNGMGLAALARPLAAVGLRRVNVSLDALDPEVFRRLTGGGDVRRVLDGIEAARAAGLVPVKINAVVTAGVNEDQAVPLVARFADAPDIEVRFIERMPFGTTERRHAPAAGIRRRLAERWTLVPEGRGPGGPAVTWRLAETGGRVGFVSPLTEHFCEHCNRLRLEADGHLRTCLSRDDGPSLRELLRAGADDATIEAVIRARVWAKAAGHEAHLPEGWRAFEGVMTAIGG